MYLGASFMKESPAAFGKCMKYKDPLNFFCGLFWEGV